MLEGLAQAVIHLATAPKSNRATTAIGAALAWTFRYGDLRRLYFQTKCEHGYMLVQGRGYCLDENRNPIIERDAQGRIVYD